MRKLAERIWQAAKPLAAGDEVTTYLARRGLVLAEYPKVLRTHPALGYYVKDVGRPRAKLVATYPAMVAAVQGADGHVVTLHRTYLAHGAKAPITECKKLLSAGVNGAAVRLFEPGDELCIAEGIETALAVHLRTAKPVWAALSATNMEKLWIPADGQESRHLRRPRCELHRPGRRLRAGETSQGRRKENRSARGGRARSAPRGYRLGGCAARADRAVRREQFERVLTGAPVFRWRFDGEAAAQNGLSVTGRYHTSCRDP